MRPTIYLAGPIRKSTDPVSWRVDIQQSSSEFEWHNPIRRDVDENSSAEEVVEGDLELIDDADGLLVGWHDEVPSVGTPMEVRYAAVRPMPVVVWRRDDGKSALSPWLRYYSDVVRDQRDAALWQLHGLVSGVSRDD